MLKKIVLSYIVVGAFAVNAYAGMFDDIIKSTKDDVNNSFNKEISSAVDGAKKSVTDTAKDSIKSGVSGAWGSVKGLFNGSDKKNENKENPKEPSRD